MNWDFDGIWYYEGLKYMLDLSKDFNDYLFRRRNKRMNRTYVYEVIPSEDMVLFDYDKYKDSKNILQETFEDDTFVSYRDCIQAFDGLEKSVNYEGEYPYFSKYHGVIWRLKPGFKLRLLYECVKSEPIESNISKSEPIESNISRKYYRFYFKSMNEEIVF